MTSVCVIRSEVFTIPLHDCTSTNICLHSDFSSRLFWVDIDKQLLKEKSCVQTRQAWEPNSSKFIGVSVALKGIYQNNHCMFHIKNFARWYFSHTLIHNGVTTSECTIIHLSVLMTKNYSSNFFWFHWVLLPSFHIHSFLSQINAPKSSRHRLSPTYFNLSSSLKA